MKEAGGGGGTLKPPKGFDTSFKWRNPAGTLLYAPDFRVYVATQDGPLDLSEDIEDFICTRNINAVSSFQFTLNNKFRKYDRVLQRMARMAVFFKRVGWVQGFAGYLNTVPYLTVVPGSVTVAASCTLKKIAYTYWDPYSAESMTLFPGYNPDNITTPDGGAASSMYKMLTEVAGWPSSEIWIQKIPPKFIEQAVKIAAKAKGANPDPAMIEAVQNLLTADGFMAFPDPNAGTGVPQPTGTPGSAAPGPTNGKQPTHPCPPSFHPGPDGKCVPNTSGGGDPSSGTILVETADDPFTHFPVVCKDGTTNCVTYGDSFGAPRHAGGYHPHAGNDIMAPTGSFIVAPFNGTVEKDDNGLGGTAIIIHGQYGWVYCAHMVDGNYPVIGPVQAGQTVGYVDTTGDAAGGPSHCHFEWHPNTIPANPYKSSYGYTTIGSAIDPYPYLKIAQGKPVDSAGLGSNTMFNTAFTYPSFSIESAVFTGDRAWINDVPLIQSIAEMSQAGLRDFQSAPNGDFVAWYPDKLGVYGKAPALAIRDIELLDFKISISDDQLTTHVAVAGNPTLTDANTGIDPDWIMTNGIVSVEQQEVMQLLLGTDTNTDWKTIAEWMLPRFGIRPLRQEAGNVRDHRLEFMLALHLFMQKWSEQFLAQISVTWMPELYPGMAVVLEEHGYRFYVEQVTHQGSRSSGFTTNAVLSTPMIMKNGQWRMLALERPPEQVFTPQDEEALLIRMGKAKTGML